MYVDTAKIYIILNDMNKLKVFGYMSIYLKFTYLFSKNKLYNRIAQLVSDHLFKIFCIKYCDFLVFNAAHQNRIVS